MGEKPVWLAMRYGQRRLTPGQSAALRGARVVFVDSAEQLGWPGWIELLFHARKAADIVISTHTPGRLPTIYACQTSPELLRELAGELHQDRIDCRELWTRHHGNIRNALRELYDELAEL